jgi:nicotinamide mononucleotide transporter
MNWLDPIGAGMSLVCTYYFTQAKRLAWGLGMVAIAINSVLYWQKGIYGSVMLECIYFLSMIYGWYQWSHHHQKALRPIRYLTLKECIFLIIVALFAIILMAKALSFTSSDIPYWDAITTILSLIAQALLCLKIIHCWILWFVVDALMAAMQLYKGIPFHSAIHWSYLVLAVMGYVHWRKIYRNENGKYILNAI